MAAFDPLTERMKQVRENHSSKCIIHSKPVCVLATESTCDCGVAGPMRRHVDPYILTGEGVQNPPIGVFTTPKKPNVDPRSNPNTFCDECNKWGCGIAEHDKPPDVRKPYVRNDFDDKVDAMRNDPRHTETLDNVRRSTPPNNDNDPSFTLWLWFVTIAIVAFAFASLYVIFRVHTKG